MNNLSRNEVSSNPLSMAV